MVSGAAFVSGGPSSDKAIESHCEIVGQLRPKRRAHDPRRFRSHKVGFSAERFRDLLLPFRRVQRNIVQLRERSFNRVNLHWPAI